VCFLLGGNGLSLYFTFYELPFMNFKLLIGHYYPNNPILRLPHVYEVDEKNDKEDRGDCTKEYVKGMISFVNMRDITDISLIY
jgi:hypothetical protein